MTCSPAPPSRARAQRRPGSSSEGLTACYDDRDDRRSRRDGHWLPMRSFICTSLLLFGIGGCAAHPSSNAVSDPAPAANRKALLLDPRDQEWQKPAPPVSHIRFETTKGVFVLELHRDWGPIGADRFYNLARLGYYDDGRFHRVNKNYIAQFGL